MVSQIISNTVFKLFFFFYSYLLFSIFPIFLQDKATNVYNSGSPYEEVLQLGVGNVDKKYYRYSITI